MPFSAELRIPIDGTCLTLLKQCAGLKEAIQRATELEDEGLLRIKVLDQLILQNVYGHRADGQLKVDEDLWDRAETRLLAEVDLLDPNLMGYTGRWNLPFLRWLKSISLATREELSVQYDHERGDNPYEYVWWTFTPWPEQHEQETFGISSYEGTDDLHWGRVAVRFADGRTEISEQGQDEGAPRYL